MIIFGITGTLGAGKGTVVDYLSGKHGFFHYSVRQFLTREIEKRNMPVNRDSMVEVANDLRAKHHPAYIVEQLYQEANQAGKDCIIESIRTPGEVELLQSKPDFYLLAVDADPKIRYERVSERKSETDMISFEEFLSNEKREMNSSDPNKQNLSKCIQQADFSILNNASFDDFHHKVEQILKEIGYYDR